MTAGRFLGVSIVSALLLATLLPVRALPTPETEDPWLAYVASDGTYGIARQSEVLRDHGLDYHQVGFQHCYGTAPVETTCTMRTYTSWPAPGKVWLTGWFPPSLPHDPDGPIGLIPENGGAGSVGALVASTHLGAVGDFDRAVRLLFDCTWATPGVFGAELASAPFIACKAQYVCPPNYGRFDCIPRGNITVDFDSGMYDPSLVPPVDPAVPPLPSTAGLAPGVGTWHAILYSNN